MRALLPVLLLVAAALAGCAAPPAPQGPAAQGGEAPFWSFTDTQGREHSRDTARGNASALFFMASWCGSCRATTPRLAAVHQDFAPRGLQLFTLSYDTTDSNASLEQWKARYQQPWPHGLDPGFRAQRTFQVVSQSTVVVLDPQGQVVQKFGYPGPSEAALRGAVERAMAAA